MKSIKLVTLAIVAILFIGCATAPQVKIWRPWTRVIETEPMIPIGSKILVSIKGNTEPLFGETKLQNIEIKKKLNHNLERRGYVIDKSGYEYLIQFEFKTERRDKTISANYMSTGSYTGNYNYNASGAASIYGLSAAIAQSVSAMATSTKTTAVSSTKSVKYYSHALTIDITDRSGKLIWTGESTWDSPDINFKNDSYLAIQLLLVNLPKADNIYPEISKLQSEKFKNYYNLYLHGNYFASPALPYRTKFSNSITSTFPSYKVKNPIYLPAYADLLTTAEEALPTGNNKYNNPLDRYLWSKATLGGKYRDSKSGETFNVLINLYGQASGYIIKKCWIATDKEFSDFQNKMNLWKKALQNYYDVYEK